MRGLAALAGTDFQPWLGS